MAQNDVLKRYIDAGLAFTALTQARAEELVKDLVRIGEVQADQAREAVTDLLERSRKNSEKLLETVRTEVRQQITSLGLATHADLDKIEQRIASVIGTATGPAMAAAKKVPAKKKAPAKKAAPKKAAAKKKAAGQAGAGQEVREEGLSRWRGAASTPSWCDGAWRPAASRRRLTSRPGGSPSGERRPTRPPGLWRPASRSACSARRRGSSGRGGEKLDAALTRFAVAVEGRRAHDLGVSTGGFTDCLLQRGAASVVAVDVGYGQLHERLRDDPRVVVLERTNVRDLVPGQVGEPRRRWWSPTCPSSRSARCSPRCSRSPLPVPTWCSS